MTLRELKTNVQAHIGKSDLGAVFDLLSGQLDPSGAPFQDLIQLSSRYHRTLNDDHRGVIAREDAILEYSRIAQALIHLVGGLAEKDLGQGGALTDPQSTLPASKSKGILEDEGEARSIGPTGHNHLLVIAIDNYVHCPRLNNCVKDAKDFAHLLWERYQFDETHTYFLLDAEATRRQILTTIKDLRHKIGEQDNLLIYYSGHGQTVDGVGYWIPIEAASDNEADFVSTPDLKTRLDAIPSFHTFLIADACFAGSLFLSYKDTPSAAGEDKRSRWGLAASHSREKALDGDPGENSPFAARLLKNLRNNTGALGIQTLAAKLIDEVFTTSEGKQTPVFKPLNVKGDDSGQFVFHLKASSAAQRPKDAAIPTDGISNPPPQRIPIPQDSSAELLARLKVEVQAHIGQSELQRAFDQVEDHIAKNRATYNTFLLIKSRFSAWKGENMAGSQYEENKLVGRAAISRALLDFLNMLREQDIIK